MTPRYLVKTRRLHRQRLQQSAQGFAEGSLILPHAETAEDMGTEEDAPDGSLVVVPKSEMIEEDEEQEEEDAPDGSLVVVPKSDMAEEDDDDQDESASSPKSD